MQHKPTGATMKKHIFFCMKDGRIYYDDSKVNLEGEPYNELRYRCTVEHFAS